MTQALAGVRVLDLGQYLAGPLVALLLADQGAEVVRIEPPGGPRWDTPLNDVLHRNRHRTVTLDLTRPDDRETAMVLVAEADVLVENFRPGVMERLALGAETLLADCPGLVYCSLPGFGRHDPRAGLPGWEGVVLAAVGCYATGSKEMLKGEWWPSDGPAFTPLMLASVFGAALGAVGVVAALVARDADGAGQRVEVPLYDAFFEAIGARLLRYERNTPSGSLLGSGFYRCADGRYISLITVWHRHLEWFLHAAGHDDWVADGTADYLALMSDDSARRDLHGRLVALFATRPADAWERVGQAAGVPLAAVRDAAQWQADAATVAPDSVTTDGTGPAPVVRVRDRAAAPRSEAKTPDPTVHGPLGGVRVLDMTRVLAAPTVARVLAELGADVVKADVRPGPGRAGLREPFFHESVNRGKRTVTLDVHGPDGARQLANLCSWADVLVTNFTGPAMRRLGVDEGSLSKTAPHLVHAYVNAFGTRGPWADLRGYAEIANTVTGITARTLGEGPPSGVAPNVDFPRAPFTDYAAGILGAFGVIAAVYRRRRTGRSSSVETTLVDGACLQQLPQLFGAGDDPIGVPGLSGWTDLQQLYRVRDGWVFVGLAEEHRGRLLAAVGLARSDQHSAECLAEALAGLPTDEVSRVVAQAGGAAHPLVSMDSLLDAGGFADRLGLRLEHTSPEFGTVVQPGPVIRFDRTPMRPGALPVDDLGGYFHA